MASTTDNARYHHLRCEEARRSRSGCSPAQVLQQQAWGSTPPLRITGSHSLVDVKEAHNNRDQDDHEDHARRLQGGTAGACEETRLMEACCAWLHHAAHVALRVVFHGAYHCNNVAFFGYIKLQAGGRAGGVGTRRSACSRQPRTRSGRQSRACRQAAPAHPPLTLPNTATSVRPPTAAHVTAKAMSTTCGQRGLAQYSMAGTEQDRAPHARQVP